MRKLLCIILTLCMLCSMTVCASAEEEGTAGFSPSTREPDVIVTDGESMTPAINHAAREGETVTFQDSGTTTDPGTGGNEGGEVAGGTEGGEGGTTEGTVVADGVVNVDGGIVASGQNVTIDVEDNNVVINGSVGSSGTETLGVQLNKDATVVIEGERAVDNDKGGVIGFNGVTDTNDTGNPDLLYGIQNYSDLTLDGVTIDGTGLSNYDGFENIAVSNNNGSLTVTNGADIIAAEGDIAFDVYAYAPYYDNGPTVVIEEDAGIIQGTIDFDGTAGCVEAVENSNGTAPSLTIEGGTFKNFLLRIGEAVKGFFEPKKAETESDDTAAVAESEESVEDSKASEETMAKPANEVIKISGGTFDSKNVVDNTGNGYVFEDFLVQGYVVVEQNGMYVVMTQKEADALKAPVVESIPSDALIYIPEYVEKPAAKPAAAPAPAPAQTATVVATAPVAIEVNGTTVELTVAEEDIKVETVAPVATGKAAELKVTLAPAVLTVEGAETADVIEAITASVSVEVKGGDEVAAENFEITLDEKGELNVELSAEYLKTLGKGEHTIILKIGGIEIEFVIVIK